jgi:hypothetical protein
MDIERAARQAFDGLTLSEKDLAQELVRFEYYDAKKLNISNSMSFATRMPNKYLLISNRASTGLRSFTWTKSYEAFQKAQLPQRRRPAGSICIAIP